ncbi:MAG: putative bifunctional diguanylate cyclase/phosphodiesterase [Roseiarcus sp.]
MANANQDDARRPELDSSVLRAALAVLPTAIEVFACDGERVFANPAAPERAREAERDGAKREEAVRDGRPMLIERREFSVDGHPYRVSAATDIADQRRLQDELFQRAYFDDLTKLPNRGFFEQAVGQLIQSDEGTPDFAVAVVGFDQFDAVNEFYGRAVGDALLVEAAQRIAGPLDDGDIAARTGGDEFSLLVARARNADEVRAKIDRVLSRFKDPFYVDGLEILISASAGFSLFPLHDAAAEGLISKADAALTQAKRRCKGETQIYEPALAVRAQERARLEQNLRVAVRDRRFLCALQPKVDFRSGEIDGLEVLMRWRDENGEARAPGDSIAFALNAGLMNEMTHLLVEETLASLDAIDAAFGPDLRLGFNIAAQQAGDARFMRAFADRLAASGHAERFMIELTEEAFLLAGQFQLQVAPMLREVGAKISIDDFGVGYSSLSTLAEITADEIKVDRSFITAIHERPRNQGLLRAIESIGEALSTKVIVEGVETAEELAYLRDHTGIRVAQGYYFSPPILLGQAGSRPRLAEDWRERARPAAPSRLSERRSP